MVYGSIRETSLTSAAATQYYCRLSELYIVFEYIYVLCTKDDSPKHDSPPFFFYSVALTIQNLIFGILKCILKLFALAIGTFLEE